ncbi:MAG: DMT family transporter [Candidatus Hodarchaeales archaeon]|jgi:RarD protein
MNKRILTGYLVTIGAGFSFGAIPVFSGLLRDLGASSVEIAFLRLILGSIIAVCVTLGFYLKKSTKSQVIQSIDKSTQISFCIQGLIFTVAQISYIISISIGVAAGEAALLIQIHPVLTLILGFVFLGEKITKSKIFALFLAFSGLIILTQPWEWQSFLSSLIGDIFALSNGVFYSFYLLIGVWGYKYRKTLSPTLSVAWVLIWAQITSIPILIILTLLPLPNFLGEFNFVRILSIDILVLGTLLTIFGSLIPYGLIMLSNSFEIESSKQSILQLGEPIAAIILGAILLNEEPTIWYLVGGLPLLAAIIVIILTSNRISENKEDILA